MILDDVCPHIEGLKRYLDRNALVLTGADEMVYIECERCEIDMPVTDLYAEVIDVLGEEEAEDDE